MPQILLKNLDLIGDKAKHAPGPARAMSKTPPPIRACDVQGLHGGASGDRDRFASKVVAPPPCEGAQAQNRRRHAKLKVNNGHGTYSTRSPSCTLPADAACPRHDRRRRVHDQNPCARKNEYIDCRYERKRTSAVPNGMQRCCSSVPQHDYVVLRVPAFGA